MRAALRQLVAPLALLVAGGAVFSVACSADTEADPGTDASAAPPDASARATDASTDAKAERGAPSPPLPPPEVPPANFPGATWEPVKELAHLAEDCWNYAAVPGSITFPALKWLSCGEGCEVADVKGDYPVKEVRTESMRTIGGEAYIKLSYPYPYPEYHPVTGITQLVRLQDGEVIAALLIKIPNFNPNVRGTPACNLGASVADPRIYSVFNGRASNGKKRNYYALANLSKLGTWILAEPEALGQNLGSRGSTQSLGSGRRAVGTDLGVFLGSRDLRKTRWTRIDPEPVQTIIGGEDLVTWVESNSARVRAWEPTTESIYTLLEDAPDRTYGVASSPTRIVGIVLDPDRNQLWRSTWLQFWYLPRHPEAGAKPVSLRATTKFRLTPASPDYSLKTWGSWVGFTGDMVKEDGTQHTNTTSLVMANLDSGQYFLVKAAEGFKINSTAWTITDSYLYVSDTIAVANGDGALTQIRRIELSQLHRYATEIE